MDADEDVVEEFYGKPVSSVSFVVAVDPGVEVVRYEDGGFGVGVGEHCVVVEDLLVQFVPLLCFL